MLVGVMILARFTLLMSLATVWLGGCVVRDPDFYKIFGNLWDYMIGLLGVGVQTHVFDQ